MDNDRLVQLLAQYFGNTITREDCEDLLAYLDKGNPREVSGAIDKALEFDGPKVVLDKGQKEDIYNRLLADLQEREPLSESSATGYGGNRGITWLRIASVLAVFVSVSFFVYFSITDNRSDNPTHTAQKQDILLPDHNQAILTLADGRKIVWGDSVDGVMALESGVSIRRGEDGSIIYDGRYADVSNSGSKFNTFSTPKGHSYQLMLPDGTKVWLNTGSSIRYPVVFAGDERAVFLNGEAYFEVAQDISKPFKVDANGSTIEVLGTHFNVSAYNDDRQTITTLVEGAVNVSKEGSQVRLRPGQQAVVDGKTGEIDQREVDVRTATAWKSGYFRFEQATIPEIIGQISRWYDIDTVEYQGQFDDRFTGTFQRFKGLTQLFQNLEKLAPIRFEINEGRVVVMK